MGKTENICAGDRLPWVEDNYESLQSLNWQIHIYGKAQDEFKKNCKGFDLHEFEWSREVKSKGFIQDALYVIRPDGYIGYINNNQNLKQLGDYFKSIGKLSTTDF